MIFFPGDNCLESLAERHDSEADDIVRLSKPEQVLRLLRQKFSLHDREDCVDIFFVEPTRYEGRVWACFDNFIQVQDPVYAPPNL